MMGTGDLTTTPRMPLEGSILRCYRYLSGYWEKVLLECRLKLSAASEFNDVFDCSGTCVGAFTDEAIRKHLLKSSPFIPPDTTSPYAISPIDYSTKRPTLDLSKIKDVDGDPLYGQYFYELLYTKAEHWHYEGEWRLFCDEKYSSKGNGMCFWDFNKALLRTIDLGPNIDSDQQETIVRISKIHYPHVEVRKVDVSENEYEFSYRTLLCPRVELSAATTYQINNQKYYRVFHSQLCSVSVWGKYVAVTAACVEF